VKLFSHPQRAFGALQVLARRYVGRRRSAGIGRDGQPSIGVLPGVDGAATIVEGQPVIDLRQVGSFPRVWLHLVRRPTRRAVVRGRGQALLVQAIGIEPITLDDAS
jgi:hypothetical protein